MSISSRLKRALQDRHNPFWLRVQWLVFVVICEWDRRKASVADKDGIEKEQKFEMNTVKAIESNINDTEGDPIGTEVKQRNRTNKHRMSKTCFACTI